MRDKSLGVRVSVKRRKRPDQATASLPQCVVVEVPSGETEKVSKVKKGKESEDSCTKSLFSFVEVSRFSLL
jgi:hypothetical protein